MSPQQPLYSGIILKSEKIFIPFTQNSSKPQFSSSTALSIPDTKADSRDCLYLNDNSQKISLIILALDPFRNDLAEMCFFALPEQWQQSCVQKEDFPITALFLSYWPRKSSHYLRDVKNLMKSAEPTLC